MEVNDELVEKQEETPEQKASKIDKQYNSEMAFIAKVLGSDTAINTPRTAESGAVANVVAKLFKEREEKLAAEVLTGLQRLVDMHMESEDAIRKDEQKLKSLKLDKRKEFIKVAKAWRSKIDQQAIQKEEYANVLKTAIDAGIQTD